MSGEDLGPTLAILERLIAFDTVSAKSNLPLIDYAETYLKDLGFRIHRMPDATGAKAGLFASIGPEGAGILLSAHTDVVPTDGQVWTRDPFCLTREENRLYGRGTTDMKGYLSAMLALAAEASKTPLKEPLKLSISYDEEIGCLGIAQMTGTAGYILGNPRAAFVGEPTGMAVATGHKGKAGFRATAHGQAGHSSLAPRFSNALYVAADFIAEMRALQDRYVQTGARDEAYDIPYTTFHTGILRGGTALNIVPDRAEFLFEFRHLAEDDPKVILSEINKMAGADIDLEQIISYPGLATSQDAGITHLAATLAGTNGTCKVAYGTEAGFFDALGIPTIVCGPGSMEGQGHKPDEYITLDQMAACHAMMMRLLDHLTAPA